MSFKPYKERPYASTKEVVTRLVDGAGGAKVAAHLLGRSPTQTVAYTDPAETDEMSFDQVRRLVTATGATAPAEDLAALAHGVFLPIAPECGDLPALGARAAREMGEYVAAVLTGSAPRVQLKELDDVLRALICARVHLVAGLEGARVDEAAVADLPATAGLSAGAGLRVAS